MYLFSVTLSHLLFPPLLCVVVTVAAGEVAKDEIHLAAVEKVETDFSLYSCRNFWNVFTLQLPSKFCVLLLIVPPHIVESPEKWIGRICYNSYQYNCGQTMHASIYREKKLLLQAKGIVIILQALSSSSKPCNHIHL